MTDISTAILAINPSAEVTVNAEDFEQITWLNGTTPISKSDIETKQAELQAAYDAKAYARSRDAQYPSLKEFAEAYTEKEIGADTTKWDEYVIKYNKVRTDNPK
jgi:YHS domain-containing protein